MSITTLIIGRSSNLSQKLIKAIDNSVLISSRELSLDISLLQNYHGKKINIIFNNFQPATELGCFDFLDSYVTNSILVTSQVLAFFHSSANIVKIIYTSSSSVYGNNIYCKESDEVKPLSLHASLKVANEKLIQAYCLKNNINFSIARIFNMYGGNDRFSIISKIILASQNALNLTIVNNGNAIRDFVHIDDVVKSYQALLTTKDNPVVNIGSGIGYSIKNILDFLYNHDVHIAYDNLFKEELKESTADIRILDKLLGGIDFIDVKKYLIKELKL